jgi:hypothetical protein
LLHAEKADLHASLQLKESLRLRLRHGCVEEVVLDPMLIPRFLGLKKKVQHQSSDRFMNKGRGFFLQNFLLAVAHIGDQRWAGIVPFATDDL